MQVARFTISVYVYLGAVTSSSCSNYDRSKGGSKVRYSIKCDKVYVGRTSRWIDESNSFTEESAVRFLVKPEDDVDLFYIMSLTYVIYLHNLCHVILGRVMSF